MSDPFDTLFKSADQPGGTPTTPAPAPQVDRQLTEGTGFAPKFSALEAATSLFEVADEDTATRALTDIMELEKLEKDPSAKMLTADEANAMAGGALEVNFDKPVNEKVAREVIRRAHVRNTHNSIIANSSLGGGLTEWLARLGAGAAASITDPLEAGLSIATGGIFGAAEMAGKITFQQPFKSISKQVMKETAVAVMATNLVESAIVEGIVAQSAVANQRQYGTADYLTSVAMGTAIGTGLSQGAQIGVSWLRSRNPEISIALHKMAKEMIDADRTIDPKNTIKETMKHHYYKGDHEHLDFDVANPSAQTFYVPVDDAGGNLQMSASSFKGKDASANPYITSGYGKAQEVRLKPDAKIVDLDQPVPDDLLEALKEAKLTGAKLVKGRERPFRQVIADIAEKAKSEKAVQRVQEILEEHGYHGTVHREGDFAKVDPDLDNNPHNRLNLFNDEAIAETGAIRKHGIDPGEQKIADQRVASWRKEDAERLQSDEGKLFPSRQYEEQLDAVTDDIPEMDTPEKIIADTREGFDAHAKAIEDGEVPGMTKADVGDILESVPATRKLTDNLEDIIKKVKSCLR